MKDDNTPTVTARRRPLTPQVRIRLENAKRVQGLGARAKTKKAETKKQKLADGEEAVTTLRFPAAKKNVLNQPSKPASKFRKRQIHKSWLPTHLYHAKRARMTTPKEPLWRFAIPLTPSEKSYRATHRVGQVRGCIAWDMSYMSMIEVEGVEQSILGLLRSIGIPEDALSTKQGIKWRRGSRFWVGRVRERDGTQALIAKVEIIWCAGEENVEQDQLLKKKRKLFLRVHPSAFLQLWNEILKVAKIQRPPVMVQDLRFEIGSIKVLGPGSTEALMGALQPLLSSEETSIDAPARIWPEISSITNPACLPANALLGFEVSDPRLHHPPRTVSTQTDDDKLLQLLSSWPPDSTQFAPSLFDHTARLTASRLLPSQKSINRRKGDAVAGEFPEPLSTDPHVPVMLLANRAERNKDGQGSWTVLLPWKCILPVWYSLMYYPLSSGGNPRFGGLDEKRQIFFEQGIPWFPGDFPGTQAGWKWELDQRAKRKADWEKRPKGKRIEWDSVDIGGQKGELGRGWACDWENLLGQSVAEDITTEETAEVVKPALIVQQAPCSTVINTSTSSQTVVTIRISLLYRGIPTTCARIYRLPIKDAPLREQWIQLASSKARKPGRANTYVRPLDQLTHEKHTARAADLLSRPELDQHDIPCAGNDSYPPIPGAEDLVGFVTTGNFNLGEGRGTGIGCVLLAKMNEGDVGRNRGLCIIREVGMNLGRVARWEVV